jgi:hypothetical protein
MQVLAACVAGPALATVVADNGLAGPCSRQDAVVHTWAYKLDKVARYDSQNADASVCRFVGIGPKPRRQNAVPICQ